MDLKNVLILIAAGFNLFLGLSVYLKGKNKGTNVAYGLVALSVFYWSAGMILYRLAGSVDDSVFWCRILYTAPILISCSLLYFVFIFPKEEKEINRSVAFSVLLIAAVLEYFTFFSDLIIKNIVLVEGAEKEIIFGWLYFLYFAFIVISFLWCYLILSIKIRHLQGTFKSQAKYVFFSTIFSSFLAMISNLLLPTLGIFYFNWLGQIVTSFFMLTLIGYAIVAHRLMDIKLALRRSFVYVFSVLAIIVPAFPILYYLDKFFPQYIIYASLFISALAVLVFTPIKSYYYRIANKYFFSSLYDGSQVIAKVSDGLRSTLDVQQVYNLISDTLINSLRVKSVAVLNYQEATQQYLIQYNNGFDIGSRRLFPSDLDLHRNFIVKTKPLVVEELKQTAYQGHEQILDLLSGLKVAMIIPLNIKNETLGIIALGHKESGDMYNDEDLKTLETIASQSAIAIKNAQLYEETKQFSRTLQEEVDRQTKELKRANEELKKLDKAKSDFISIASHQLRTPLTAIKGFTSMILEGTYGELSAAVRDKTEKIFESAERLIRLVNDLLDLSHMEGGKMEFNFTKVDFDAMVKSVVEELAPTAEKKKLKFTWKAPDDEFWVKADEQKLRQVVMNLIDNAIKYTQKGSVKILLEHQDGQAVMSVKDTGIGLAPGESDHLFQKFMRGQEASHYHTEGAGVGLYVAKQLIEAHQGQVWAESEGEDKGTAFYIKLPEWQG